MQSPNHFEIGATYRHEPSGFVGVAQPFSLPWQRRYVTFS